MADIWYFSNKFSEGEKVSIIDISMAKMVGISEDYANTLLNRILTIKSVKTSTGGYYLLENDEYIWPERMFVSMENKPC